MRDPKARLREAQELRAKLEKRLDAVELRKLDLLKDRRYYNASALIDGSLTEKEMRSEYSRFRSVANKRIARIEAEHYRSRPEGPFKKLSELTKEEVAFELSSVIKYLENKESSLAYKRARHAYEQAAFREFIEREKLGRRRTTHLEDIAKGMETEEGFEDVRDFWAWVDEHLDRFFYPSEVLLRVYAELSRRHIPFTDIFEELFTDEEKEKIEDADKAIDKAMEYFTKNIAKMEKIPDDITTAAAMRKELEKRTRRKINVRSAYAKKGKKK